MKKNTYAKIVAVVIVIGIIASFALTPILYLLQK